MPSGPLNRLPVGLLGFFGLNDSRGYPQAITELLAPVMDLTYLYAMQRVEFTTATSAGIAVGTLQFGPGQTDPPRGPVLVLNAGCVFTAPAGTVEAQIGVVSNPTGIFVPLNNSNVVQNRTGGIGILDPVWLSETDSMAVRIHTVSGAVDVTNTVRFVRFPQ